jgi:Zn-dependent protease with chaperone function
MLFTFRNNLYASALQVYDYLMYLRHYYLDSGISQVLGAMLFSLSFVIAGMLFTYWSYTALHLLAVQGDELSDSELDSLHWNRRRRFLGRQLSRARRFAPRWFLAL